MTKEIAEQLLTICGGLFEKELHIEIFGSISCSVDTGIVEDVKSVPDEDGYSIGVEIKGDEGEFTIYHVDVAEIDLEDDMAELASDDTEFICKLITKDGLEVYIHEIV